MKVDFGYEKKQFFKGQIRKLRSKKYFLEGRERLMKFCENSAFLSEK